MFSTRSSEYKRGTVAGLALLSVLPLSLTGCGGANDPVSTRSRLQGTYTYGFETEEFRPCGSDTAYWVTDGTQAIRDAVPADYAGQGITTVYVDLDGTVSPKGKFGNQSLYEHEISVNQIYFGSTTIPDACQQNNL